LQWWLKVLSYKFQTLQKLSAWDRWKKALLARFYPTQMQWFVSKLNLRISSCL
jgi:hypothetical protein